MDKPTLTVRRLLDGGFEETGCWELNSARDLVHRIEVPREAGVYAFAINGVVHYVGLASKSLRQRLGFYRKPGATQSTNIRLNETIRGHIGDGTVVQILVARPPEHQWNGFRLSSPEGLEAGLIADYHLPWNIRGAPQTVAVDAAPGTTVRGAGSSVADKILALVERRSGMTEIEIAKALYGPSAVQQRVNADCRLLLGKGLIKRRGAGGPSDPFVYVATRQGNHQD